MDKTTIVWEDMKLTLPLYSVFLLLIALFLSLFLTCAGKFVSFQHVSAVFFYFIYFIQLYIFSAFQYLFERYIIIIILNHC